MNRIQQQLLPGILQKAAIIAGLIILINPCFAQDTYPFADTAIHAEQRIDNLLSLMTLDEKVTCLSTNPSIPRLGVKGTSHVEGLHGLARGGPSNWGRRDPVTTTIFPQAIGLAESWDPIVLKKVASVEAYEVRYLFQSPKYGKGGLVVRAPNADMGRDIRWGRNEECYGEDAFLTGVLTTAFIKGLQGDHPKYWLTASLMKHFLANSNENGRDSSSSNFDDRLYREYYSYPFMKGVTEGGSRAYMAAYNAYNEIPCTVHPMLKEITVKEWGQNGIICTDGGALRLLVTAHKEYPDLELAAAACIKAGIGQFLDRYTDGVKGALEKGYITETDIDSVLRGNFRVMLRLGLLDPPEKVLYSKIGLADTIDPWLKEEHKSIVRDVTRKTIVLLKNSDKTLPVERKRIRSIAVIGPLADTVLLDWYSGTPPYVISPFEGIKSNAGDAINVSCYSGNDNDSAVNLAKNSDLVVICAGNHPVCHYADWGKCTVPSDGREAVDRKSITLEQEVMIQKIYAANPNSILVLISSFPYAVNWSQENLPAILHMTHCSQEM
ncbi:MAG: glycoside hydrolase family 3 C-terminal domain-containing protein, partial [Bacteroidales bacterium]|nr:glycoside hydrolase family 3 C-terminal domain-containing protein [Bacteroidales bacterium]